MLEKIVKRSVKTKKELKKGEIDLNESKKQVALARYKLLLWKYQINIKSKKLRNREHINIPNRNYEIIEFLSGEYENFPILD